MSDEHNHPSKPQNSDPNENSVVCYCFRLTTKDLKEAYAKAGSLKELEKQTKVGTACIGCKVILHSLFGETPTDHYEGNMRPPEGSPCMKPGSRMMKGLIVANENLDSKVYCSNGVAPQFGNCNADTEIEYTLVDHRGIPVIMEKKTMPTNETFVFDTKNVKLPRPFIGMFMLSLSRGNLGASRFNIYWSNRNGTTSTHENGNTGRPRAFVPLVVTKQFLEGPNTIHMGLMNPHSKNCTVKFTVFDVDTKEDLAWSTELPSYCSSWLNVSEFLYTRAVERNPYGRYALRMESTSLDPHAAPTFYFFMHNHTTDLWTCNHL